MQSTVSKIGTTLGSSARDILLIVVSILIAFFLDAWWDDRNEQNEIRESLRGIYTDFESTKDELAAVTYANNAYTKNVAMLMSMEPENIAELSTEKRSELAHLLPRGGLTFEPVLGSVEALISSGQLNRIRNLEVRRLIAAWPALLDEIGEDQEILIDTYMAIQERNVALGIYLQSARAELGHTSAQPAQQILSTVVSDAEMLNRLAAHRFAVTALGEELQAVNEHLDEILRVLGQALPAGNR